MEIEQERRKLIREQEKIKRESEYRSSTYNSIRNLSRERLSQEKIKEEVNRMLNRVERICKAVPNLIGLSLSDSLNRNWEITIERSEEDGDLTNDGEIFMVLLNRAHTEAVNISLTDTGANIHYGILFWPDSEDYGSPENNLPAVILARQRFNDLFDPLEKALGLRQGEPLSLSR